MNSPLLLVLASLGIATLAGCHRAESPAAVQEKVVTAAYDLAVTDAEGSHRVALAECGALAGDAQKACRDKADATFAMAKAYAKASFVERQ